MIPRLQLADLSIELQQLLRRRVDRLGYLGEFFQAMGHQPEALAHFVGWTESLKRALPKNLTELIALTVSTRAENDYERVQHERLGLTLGLSEGWVRAVERLEPGASAALDKAEQAVQALTLGMLDRTGRACADELRAVEAQLGDHEETVAVLFTIARYAAHATIANVLTLTPPVPSPISRRA